LQIKESHSHKSIGEKFSNDNNIIRLAKFTNYKVQY
jgi:hypothetical protein